MRVRPAQDSKTHATSIPDAGPIWEARDVAESPGLPREGESAERTASAAAVIRVDDAGRIHEWNDEAQRMFGYSAAEAARLKLSDLVPLRSRDRHFESFRARMLADETGGFDRVLCVNALGRDGREFPVQVHVAVSRCGSERMATAIITRGQQPKAIAEQLNDARQQLDFHMQCRPLAYIVADRRLCIVEWNSAAEKLFGSAKGEVVGTRVTGLFSRDIRSEVEHAFREMLRAGDPVHEVHDAVRKDGSRFPCEWCGGPLRDSAGLVHGFALLARDVSDREFTESRLRDAQKLESLGVLASGVAHDFNSSLMIILGNASLLRGLSDMSPRAGQLLASIEEAALRAGRLIKHLLAFARTGRHNPQLTDLNTIVRDCLSFVRSSVGPMHDIQAQPAESLPAVLCDHSQIEQIILNLCGNARDAMPGGGRIQLSTRRGFVSAAEAARCTPHDAPPGEYVQLAVADTGCGMDRNTLGRIFDPFFTTKPEGHGLGLSAVLGILRQHQGMVGVETAPGRGTTVRVFLPLARP